MQVPVRMVTSQDFDIGLQLNIFGKIKAML